MVKAIEADPTVVALVESNRLALLEVRVTVRAVGAAIARLIELAQAELYAMLPVPVPVME
jgi:hypothetical protein